MRLSLRQIIAWSGICLWLSISTPAIANPDNTGNLQVCLDAAQGPLAQMECFRGLPYRVDGALDEYGRWTTWARPDEQFATPGLNCSGLTTAISRVVWGQSLSLNEAQRDRLNDSGPGSPMGEDWDFGLDLILNLTDGLPRRLIPDPYNSQDIDSRLWNALDLRGVNIDSNEFPIMLAQLQPHHIYYFAISKPDSRFKGGISFYHVGVLFKEGSQIWMYHATARGGVYRVNLAGENGVAWIRHHYRATPRGSRYMQLVEVPLP